MGVPEKFVGNYRAAQAFLDRLEALCRSRGALEALRGSAAYASFQERWKLSVYFGLRFQVRRAFAALKRAHLLQWGKGVLVMTWSSRGSKAAI